MRVHKKVGLWKAADTIMVPTVQSLADVKDLTSIMFVGGHHQLGDGGGGIFRYVPSLDNTLANNGTIIASSWDATGAWKRDFCVSEYCLEWFGVPAAFISLQAAYGTHGAQVTVITNGKAGTYKFDSSKVGDHDGESNVNGWILSVGTVRIIAEELLFAGSPVNQVITTADTPQVISLGIPQVKAELSVNAAGVITFTEGGTYAFDCKFAAKAEAATLNHQIFFGSAINDVMLPHTEFLEWGITRITEHMTLSGRVTVNAGDTLSFKMYSSGTPDATSGLVAVSPAQAGWNTTYSAVATITVLTNKGEI